MSNITVNNKSQLKDALNSDVNEIIIKDKKLVKQLKAIKIEII
ncbi:hypothetical protein ACWJJH_02910 [Endozoicomonadaceae bacterium StTr2]